MRFGSLKSNRLTARIATPVNDSPPPNLPDAAKTICSAHNEKAFSTPWDAEKKHLTHIQRRRRALDKGSYINEKKTTGRKLHLQLQRLKVKSELIGLVQVHDVYPKQEWTVPGLHH